jgi:hypothetical protein
MNDLGAPAEVLTLHIRLLDTKEIRKAGNKRVPSLERPEATGSGLGVFSGREPVHSFSPPPSLRLEKAKRIARKARRGTGTPNGIAGKAGLLFGIAGLQF